MAGTGRRAGRRAGGAWREPPPRSSRAGEAGRGRKPSLNQFKNSGVVTVSTAALFSPRAERGPAGGRARGRRGAASRPPERPARYFCPLGPSARGTLAAGARGAHRPRDRGKSDVTATSHSAFKTPGSEPSSARVNVKNHLSRMSVFHLPPANAPGKR